MSQSLLTVFKIIVISFLASNISCSRNFLEGFADLEEDNALYYEALENIRKARYDEAITNCTDMSAGYLAERGPSALCASAFAGRGGFLMFNMLDDLAAYDPGDATRPSLLDYYISILDFADTTASDRDDLKTAEELMRNIGAASDRTEDENAFLALLDIYMLAVYANSLGDTDDDDAVDGVFVCALRTGTAAEQQIAADIGLAYWDLSKSLAELAANPTFTDLNDAVNDPVTGACEILQTGGQDLCSAADPLALTAQETKGGLSLFREGGAAGIDECGGNQDILTCNCP